MTDNAALVSLGQEPARPTPQAKWPGRPSDPTDQKTGTSRILERLYNQGRDRLEAGEGLSESWSGAFAALLVRIAADNDAELISDTQDRTRRLAAFASRALSAAEATRRASPADANSPESSHLALIQSLARVETLLAVADASAGVVEPRAWALKLEPSTLKARILHSLTTELPTDNENVLTAVGTTRSELSRALRELAEHGLVLRRTFGRKAAWTLTGSGAEALAMLREHEPKRSATPAGSQQGPAEVSEGTQDQIDIALAFFRGESADWNAPVEEGSDLYEAMLQGPNCIVVEPHRRYKYDGVHKLRDQINDAAAVYLRVDEPVHELFETGSFRSKTATGAQDMDIDFFGILPSLMRSVIEGAMPTRRGQVKSPPKNARTGPGDVKAAASALPSDEELRYLVIGPSTGNSIYQTIGRTPVRRSDRHVVPNGDGGWDVRAPDAERASAHADTQVAAIKRATEIVRNSGGGEIHVHGKDGEIRESTRVRARERRS